MIVTMKAHRNLPWFWISIFLSLLLTLPIGWGEAKGSDLVSNETLSSDFETNMQDQLKKLGVPGFAAAIVKNGELKWSSGYGMANFETGSMTTADTVFIWASVSKLMTGTAAMHYFDATGGFELNANISRYLPYSVSIPDCPAGEVTMKQLLTHTSSIADNWAEITPYYNFNGVDSSIPLANYTYGYLVPGGVYYDERNNFLKTCPGTKAAYSNIGVVTAGYVVESLSGIPLHQYAKEQIMEPLEMTTSSYMLADLNESLLAMPYNKKNQPYGHYTYPDYPDGQLRTSVNQMAKFLNMFIKKGIYGNGNQRLLSEATVDLMRTRQVPDLDPTQGLAWYYHSFKDRPEVLGHNGGDYGSSSYMFFDPSDEAGVILVANGEWNWSAADKLMAYLFAVSQRF